MDVRTVTPSAKPFATRKSTPAARSGLRTAFYRSGERRFFGFVVDTDDPSRKFSVEILVDGYPVQVMRADAEVAELVKQKIGDGYYGFSFALGAASLGDSAVVEARLANLGTTLGVPIVLARPPDAVPAASGSGALRWLGGLRFSGWIAGPDDSASAETITTGNVLVDGTLITRVNATVWSHIGTTAADARAVRAFDFHLPEKFADGHTHQLELVDDAGESLSGDPLFFIAYADGLRETLAGRGLSEEEGLRAQLLDRLLPMSVPFSDYQGWRERFLTLPGPSVPLTGAVIMVGAGAAADTLASLNEQTHTDWIAASLPPTDNPVGLRSELVQQFLAGDAANCDFVVFALAGTLFTPGALQRIAGALAEFPEAQLVYADFELRSDDGSIWPLALPAFDYERMLEQGYGAYLFALRRAAAKRVLDHGAADLYRLFNCALDDGNVSAIDIVHLPGPLATLPGFDANGAGLALAAAASEHLQHRGIRAQATSRRAGVLPAAQIARMHKRIPATIVIPTRNRQHLLKSCLESIRPAVERTRAEILVIDNESSDPDTLDYLAELERGTATVLRVSGDFNFSRLTNYAAKAAHGEILCLLNNDVKALDDRWLDEMLSRIVERDVGAVGAKLLWPSGVVQHGGVVLGPSFAATHAFNDRIDSDVGYTDLLCVAHECSAVTAACMITRRRDFLAVGGMDEVRFPVNFNDVDYCLKLRAKDMRIVFTPHAKLLHLEAASRGSDLRADQAGRFKRELQNLRAKWGAVLAADPYYSPMLSRDPIPFSALAWPPGPMGARLNRPPLATAIPPGF